METGAEYISHIRQSFQDRNCFRAGSTNHGRELLYKSRLYEGDRLIAEYDGATLLQRYVHGLGVDEPIVWYEGAGLTNRRWLHTDERGSVMAESDGPGNATVYGYGPYGEPSNWVGSRFRYTGQIMLPEVELYHYFSSELGASVAPLLCKRQINDTT